MRIRRFLSALAVVVAIGVGLPLLMSDAPAPSTTGGAASSQPASAPTSRPQDVVADATISPWKPVFVGVETCQGSTATPRPLQMRAVRVDLKAEGIDFLVTPSNGDEPLEVNARTTSDFLSEFKCQVAINASPFAPLATRPAQPQDVLGLSVSRGDRYSRPNDYDALMIATDPLKAWIAEGPQKPGGVWNGAAGFYIFLKKGRNVGTMKDRHPRSAAGVTRDGRYLILMVIDGRQAGYSEGTSTAETAEWMRRLGASDGLNLDGGGSTALVIEGPDGQPLTLNRPSGGVQRRVANHIGVFAKKLP